MKTEDVMYNRHTHTHTHIYYSAIKIFIYYSSIKTE